MNIAQNPNSELSHFAVNTPQVFEIPETFRETARQFQEAMMQYSCAIREFKTKLEVLNDEFQVQRSHNPISYIKYRVKKPASILEKLKRRGYPVTLQSVEDNLHDVAGIRVICSYVQDIYMVADMLTSQNDITLLEVKDYIANPKPNGYRSLHLIVKTPIFLKEGKKMMEYTLYAYTFVIVKQYSFPRGFRHMRTNGKENIFLRKQGMQGRVTQCCGIYLIGWKHWLFRFRRTRSFLL